MSNFTHALVTGGAGFIGSYLVRELLEHGFEVTVLDNLSMGTRSVVDSRARFIEGDIRTQNDVNAALRGVDCVFHLAAKVTIRGSFEMFYDDVDCNMMGTMNLLRCLDRDAVRHFTFASSMAVYADSPTPEPVPEGHDCEPISPYGVSKLASERICKLLLKGAGIPFTALRYFNTFGAGQRFTPYVGVITIFATKLLREEQPTIFGDGEQRRDFVHVKDIVSGTIASLSGEPGTYNLGTARATSVNQLADLLAEHINPGIKAAYAPEQPGELRFSIADISAATSKLGYRPKHSLEADIESVISEIRTLEN
ncbi:NAD-dependent epimerase/dehydratase family protein [candidate division KSB1 bacterium]|nr:NAD-dependent epimerase/dehydratase family protein [candidate division KSB1 bacterium]